MGLYEQTTWKPTFANKVIQRSLHIKCNTDSSCPPLYIYYLGLLYNKCYSSKMSIYIGVISVVIDTLELNRYQFRKFTIYCGWPLEQRSLHIFFPLYLSSLAICLLFYNILFSFFFFFSKKRTLSPKQEGDFGPVTGPSHWIYFL